jgi:hypothetical protein
MEPKIPDPIHVESVSDNHRTVVVTYEAMEFTFLVSEDGKKMTRIGYKNYGSHVYVEPPRSIEKQCRQRAWIVLNTYAKEDKDYKEIPVTEAEEEHNFHECMAFFEKVSQPELFAAA